MLRRLLQKIRTRLWRWGWLYPPTLGWVDLVYEVANTPGWKDDQERVVGLPPAWTLLRKSNGKWTAYEDTCAWSGKPVSGSVPIQNPNAENPFDLTRWGVRCARCGVPIHVLYSGMRTTGDVPSCPPCRRVVNQAKRGE